ncbi:transposon Tf2-6 polyprotein [Nephila pilipes]|uniref:Transposon Tf2-6 polyprotein n=1 Tax=Nephila pilipes TaxID=299642 RepID=A0A8X6NQB8_NEPPI|nr:transposon Tf2-6 polyprotein [Nephila pilipes]
MQSHKVNNTVCRPPISCYGCGNPGFIKAKYPKCSLKKERVSVITLQMFTCVTSPVTLLDIEVHKATGTVCVDTGSANIPLPTNDSPVEMNNSSCPTSSISSDVPVQSTPADETEASDLHLREEGQDLDAEE